MEVCVTNRDGPHGPAIVILTHAVHLQERGRQTHLSKLVANQRSLKKEIIDLSATKAEREAERDALVKKRTDIIQKITSELYRITTQGDAVYERVIEQGAKARNDKKFLVDAEVSVLWLLWHWCPFASDLWI